MYIKKLIGKKCYLSPIDCNDAEQYASWLNDLEICSFLTLASSVIPVEGERDFLQKLSKEHNYGIVDMETNQLLGNVGLLSIDHLNQTAEIGIFIGAKEYWGRGYGEEALSLLIDYSFKFLNLHAILLRVYSFNSRAIACYKKIGFKRIGEIRQALLRNRERHNIILMDLLSEDFY